MRHELSTVIEDTLEALIVATAKVPSTELPTSDASVLHALDVVRAALRCHYSDFLPATGAPDRLEEVAIVC